MAFLRDNLTCDLMTKVLDTYQPWCLHTAVLTNVDLFLVWNRVPVYICTHQY